ncbi:hypothetical protein GTY80_53125, partial [Amycolatopsis sp. SID8362]|nr:hypothetical protein [Amycolatopsis sp. SID8362]NED48665.1 hypothetical protein [Amycolatopsis sp. SID8362]
EGPRARALLARKRAARAADERRRPLETYRVRELAEMTGDIFDDHRGFARARRAFLANQPGRPPEASVVPAPRVPEIASRIAHRNE